MANCHWRHKNVTDEELARHPVPSVLVGIITPAKKFARRELLRAVYRVTAHPNVTVRFVVGLPENEDDAIRVALEQKAYGDMIQLDMKENMDDGKTFRYFEYLSKHEPYDYVMKADDDAFVHSHNLVRALRPLPRQRLYYGLLCGPPTVLQWMSGMGYVMSWDSVLWLVNFNPPDKTGIEDIKISNWLGQGPQREHTVSEQCLYYQQPNSPVPGRTHGYIDETIVVHGMKNDVDWKEALRFFFGALPKGGKKGPSLPDRSWSDHAGVVTGMY
ncbi:hypothetical protein THASP1DRAFT_20146 [Thamnocephalis sphaerospora]|uniref:Hexosyltransferase n=1 Tax=Thamnocephalis sphaerospora TaxID=78915 RepID=A0A4P9XHQ1_9FUNG|nr:hypothetical protein THASP1DRAFT_20146 [Thamnocephalis sphaerospora]|eukprot:RKP05146.1 hypothetical protein THASP1DRAFT_20146 [Thamnocephalis sphaerospora]